MKYPIVAALLMLVVFTSGCTIPVLNIEIPGLPDIFGGPTLVQYEHDILVVKSLEANPPEIDSGQSTRIIAYIENKGDKTIPISESGQLSQPVKVVLYDYCEGLFEATLKTCGDKSVDVKGPDGEVCEIGKMLPGEIVPVIWTLDQKEDVKLRTICPPDGIKVSVVYDYKTESLSTISFISEAELRKNLMERSHKRTESYIVVGQGPIKGYITVEDKQPIPVYDGARTVLAFQAFNRGSGSLASSAIRKVRINLGGLVTQADCQFVESVAAPNTYMPKDDVKLIGVSSSKMLCKIDLSYLKDVVKKETTKHVTTTLEYNYTFTKSVPVIVNPKISG